MVHRRKAFGREHGSTSLDESHLVLTKVLSPRRETAAHAATAACAIGGRTHARQHRKPLGLGLACDATRSSLHRSIPYRHARKQTRRCQDNARETPHWF